jgi:hypothetical protein
MPAALLPAPTTTTTTTPPPTPPRRILHLGLGRVADARVPQVQLALLLVVRDLLVRVCVARPPFAANPRYAPPR